MPSQQDIARRLGVSVMTVSRALRGLPVVRPGLAEAVRRTAAELGYRPDPLVQALMVQRARRRSASTGLVVAWIGRGCPDWARDAKADARHPFCRYHEAARRRLEAAGIRLEDFGWPEGEVTHDAARLGRTLRARGVAGLLLGPASGGEPLPVDNPGDFALVQVGRSRHHAQVDRVAGDAFQAMLECMDRLRGAGHRRIGFFDGAAHSLRNERRWEAAFAIASPGPARIPPELVEDEVGFTPATLAAYARRHRLDAVVSGRLRVAAWLRADRTMARLGFACLSLDDASGPVPGVVADFEGIASGAAELLIDAIHAGRRGLRPLSRTLSLRGAWYPGEAGNPPARVRVARACARAPA